MARLKVMIATLGAVAVANTASATVINLSDVSSDETDAGLLNATMDFSVLGNTLSLTVTNNTADPSAYKINELYFNAPDDVTLSLDALAGWSMQTDAMANGFGSFDFALIDGQGGSPNQIIAGESVTFTFEILTGTPGKIDFVSLFSTAPGPEGAAIVAAKFVEGPGDDSAYGAAVPTPGVLALLGAAGLVSGRRRRRRA